MINRNLRIFKVSLPEYIVPSGTNEWRIRIWVQPRAKRTAVIGLYQGCLKIRISSPPVDDKANKELSSYLAKRLGLRPHQVLLESGQSRRQKTLRIRAEREPEWSSLAGEV